MKPSDPLTPEQLERFTRSEAAYLLVDDEQGPFPGTKAWCLEVERNLTEVLTAAIDAGLVVRVEERDPGRLEEEVERLRIWRATKVARARGLAEALVTRPADYSAKGAQSVAREIVRLLLPQPEREDPPSDEKPLGRIRESELNAALERERSDPESPLSVAGREACPDCGGNGKLMQPPRRPASGAPSTGWPCSRCHGTGTVSTDKEDCICRGERGEREKAPPERRPVRNLDEQFANIDKLLDSSTGSR